MFTRREVKMMKKGFYPSRCGKSARSMDSSSILINDGTKNRFQRRGNFKGNHRNKSGIMTVLGTQRWVSVFQIIEGRKILHWHPKH